MTGIHHAGSNNIHFTCACEQSERLQLATVKACIKYQQQLAPPLNWPPVVQANLEKEVEREKALAEAEGRIKENRENEDVNRRAMQLRLEEERKKLVEAINTTFTNLGTGTLALLTDKDKLGTALAGLTVLALGVYSAREGTRVAGQVFSR